MQEGSLKLNTPVCKRQPRDALRKRKKNNTLQCNIKPNHRLKLLFAKQDPESFEGQVPLILLKHVFISTADTSTFLGVRSACSPHKSPSEHRKNSQVKLLPLEEAKHKNV